MYYAIDPSKDNQIVTANSIPYNERKEAGRKYYCMYGFHRNGNADGMAECTFVNCVHRTSHFRHLAGQSCIYSVLYPEQFNNEYHSKWISCIRTENIYRHWLYDSLADVRFANQTILIRHSLQTKKSIDKYEALAEESGKKVIWILNGMDVRTNFVKFSPQNSSYTCYMNFGCKVDINRYSDNSVVFIDNGSKYLYRVILDRHARRYGYEVKVWDVNIFMRYFLENICDTSILAERKYTSTEEEMDTFIRNKELRIKLRDVRFIIRKKVAKIRVFNESLAYFNRLIQRYTYNYMFKDEERKQALITKNRLLDELQDEIYTYFRNLIIQAEEEYEEKEENRLFADIKREAVYDDCLDYFRALTVMYEEEYWDIEEERIQKYEKQKEYIENERRKRDEILRREMEKRRQVELFRQSCNYQVIIHYDYIFRGDVEPKHHDHYCDDITSIVATYKSVVPIEHKINNTLYYIIVINKKGEYTILYDNGRQDCSSHKRCNKLCTEIEYIRKHTCIKLRETSNGFIEKDSI